MLFNIWTVAATEDGLDPIVSKVFRGKANAPIVNTEKDTEKNNAEIKKDPGKLAPNNYKVVTVYVN